MPSDPYVGSLLRTLILSKPGARALELGTGVGLSLSWMIDGLSDGGHVVSIDADAALVNLVGEYFRDDPRVTLVHEDGAAWLERYAGPAFDLVFADAWPGKYSHLEEAVGLLRPGGFYVIDDMDEQPNWPEGHDEKAAALMTRLEAREDLVATKISWSTGVVVAVKR